MSYGGYYAVDLDGTLAEYHGWKGVTHIGKPVENMVNIIKEHLRKGDTVKIFTARVCRDSEENGIKYSKEDIAKIIQDWTEDVFGVRLEVTNSKDYGMILLYDDRCIQVKPNTGFLVGYE